MVARPKLMGMLLLLLGSVMLTGCSHYGPRTDGQRGLLGRKKPMEAPPQLAPLAIQGPAPKSGPSAAAPTAQTPKNTGTDIVAVQAIQPAETAAKGINPPQMLPVPSQPSAPGNPLDALKDLYHRAAQKHASMDSYTVRLRRREVVGNQSRPEELMLFHFRKEPFSVYFKWLDGEGKGREAVYVKGRYENALHTLTAAGDVFFLPAGKRFKVAPDSMLVKSKSRYPITEAGLGGLIERYGRLVATAEKGDPREGSAKYLGLLKRPEYEIQVEGVLQTIPPSSDPQLPRGGQRLWFFDPTLSLPMLIVTQDDTGREVEYYCHDRFMFPVQLGDDDFNPDVLWKTR